MLKRLPRASVFWFLCAVLHPLSAKAEITGDTPELDTQVQQCLGTYSGCTAPEVERVAKVVEELSSASVKVIRDKKSSCPQINKDSCPSLVGQRTAGVPVEDRCGYTSGGFAGLPAEIRIAADLNSNDFCEVLIHELHHVWERRNIVSTIPEVKRTAFLPAGCDSLGDALDLKKNNKLYVSGSEVVAVELQNQYNLCRCRPPTNCYGACNLSEDFLPFCGDGKTDPGEECDPGNPLAAPDVSGCAPNTNCGPVNSRDACQCVPANRCYNLGEICHRAAVQGGNGTCVPTVAGDAVCHSEGRIFCFQRTAASCDTEADCSPKSSCLAASRCTTKAGICSHWLWGTTPDWCVQ